MLLKDLFGDTTRIKILEELISNWDYFLSVDEISRMADVSKKSVYIHIKELNSIGLLLSDGDGFKKFKLNPKDKRAIALALIESDEFLRNLDNWETGSEMDENHLTFEVSNMSDNNLLKVNSKKMNDALKSIPLINFIM